MKHGNGTMVKQHDSNRLKADKRNENDKNPLLNENTRGFLHHLSEIAATVILFGIGSMAGAFLGFWFAHIFNLI